MEFVASVGVRHSPRQHTHTHTPRFLSSKNDSLNLVDHFVFFVIFVVRLEFKNKKLCLWQKFFEKSLRNLIS